MGALLQVVARLLVVAFVFLLDLKLQTSVGFYKEANLPSNFSKIE